MSKTTNYPLASAGRRIGMRICDYLVVITLFILITLSLTWFCFDSSLTTIKPGQHTLLSGMLLLSHTINLIVWWSYYVLSPRLFHGFSLFGFVFKLKIVWQKTDHLLFRLFKFQGFDVIFLFAIMIIFYATTFAFDNPVLFIQNTFTLNGMTQASSDMKMVSSIFITLYILSVFPILGVFVNTLMNSHQANFIDDWCELYLAHLKTETKKSIPSTPTAVLPGVIDLDELERL